MNKNEDLMLKSPLHSGTSRRGALKKLGIGAAALAGMGTLAKRAQAATITANDAAVLQVALNLEYLEAQYYHYATYGTMLDAGLQTGSGTQGGVTIKANPRVPFSSNAVRNYAFEITSDERLHVLYLRNVLEFYGITPVAQPQLDLLNSFNALAQAAGIGSSFDPFANDESFLLGAFIFEDVGVTAYGGGIGAVQDPQIIYQVLARIMGTEAYHASEIRTTIYGAFPAALPIAAKISNLRDNLDDAAVPDGVNGDDDQPITDANGLANIVPADNVARVFVRTPQQVLNIVYASASGTPGGFYPNGLNGPIR